ncbi:unnamed protein product [Xylocopa violacea]|uniref:Uncharacterized protein n=1 Tax=Xylocopa violacea TaxID=135666 RepID=A0ABP1N097_XYLVO
MDQSEVDADYAESEDTFVPCPHTFLSCRSIRIGSYKYLPKDKILISQTGIRLDVPSLGNDKAIVTLDINIEDIVKILAHFGKPIPVIFFYTTPDSGAMIRELLGMQDPSGPYYDPAGKEYAQKQITLLPEKLTNESKIVIKYLFRPRASMN